MLAGSTVKEPAAVQGVVGASSDGSSVYFVAQGALPSNSREHKDAAGTVISESAEPGHDNLYLWREGQPLAFIADSHQKTTNSLEKPVQTKSILVFGSRMLGRVRLRSRRMGVVWCSSRWKS